MNKAPVTFHAQPLHDLKKTKTWSQSRDKLVSVACAEICETLCNNFHDLLTTATDSREIVLVVCHSYVTLDITIHLSMCCCSQE